MLLEDMTRRTWERYERADRLYREHPTRYRLRLALLIAESFVIGTLLLGVVAFLVGICIAHPVKDFQLIIFLVINTALSVLTYYRIITDRPWEEFPLLKEADFPELFRAVRETAAAMRAPRVDEIRLAPAEFDAFVTSSFALLPGLRRHILVIGYPLLCAMSERAFRGVLAHELGHIVHHDLVWSGLVAHVLTFWDATQLGVFTWALGPWKKWFFLRFDILLTPSRRAAESAADRVIAERFGADTLRQTLCQLAVREEDADSGAIFVPILRHEAAEHVPASNLFREAVRRPLAPEEVRKRLAAALRRVEPVTEEHPSIRERLDTDDVASLIAPATAAPDAFEHFAGHGHVIDKLVNDWCRDGLADSERELRERAEVAARELADRPADDALDDDSALHVADNLLALDRKDDAEALLRKVFAAHPGFVAVEAAILSSDLERAADPAARDRIVARLEQLLRLRPVLVFTLNDPLIGCYLEQGRTDRVKEFLDLRAGGAKAVQKATSAPLRPTDEIIPYHLTPGETETILAATDHKLVCAIYAVSRQYPGTGLTDDWLVICRRKWIFTFKSYNEALTTMDDALPFRCVLGNKQLLRRLDTLGIKPVPVPRKAQ